MFESGIPRRFTVRYLYRRVCITTGDGNEGVITFLGHSPCAEGRWPISGLLYGSGTYPVIEPIPGGTDENGPVVGVSRARCMCAIKVGDDLLAGSQTADRPNGQTDEQLVEVHGTVVSATRHLLRHDHTEFQFSASKLFLVRAAMHGEQHHVTAVGDV